MVRSLLRPCVCVLSVLSVLACGVTFGNEYRLASTNQGFEEGFRNWILTGSQDSPAFVEQRDWTPDPNDPVQARLGTNFVTISFEAKTTGVGQYVAIDPETQYQILACQGDKSFGWAAFGITYYDAFWNEIDIYRKQFGPPPNIPYGKGGGVLPYSFGCEVPDGAVFAFIWVWQEDDGSPCQFDEFALYDFLPSDSSNLALNGDFQTGNTSVLSNEEPTAYLNGAEFWETNADDGSIVWDSELQQLKMGDTSEDLIYQRVPVVATQNYTLSISYRRTPDPNAPVPDTGGGPIPWAIADVDFFDEFGNKLGSIQSSNIPLQSTADQGATVTRSFTPPLGTAYSYAWVWTQATNAEFQTLNLSEFRLTQNAPDTTPPTATLKTSRITELNFRGFVSISVDYVDDDSDFPDRPFDIDTLTVTGPNDYEAKVNGIAGGSLPDTGIFEIYELPGIFDSSANGEYMVFLNENALLDEAGNVTPAQLLGTFELALPD